MQTTEEIQFRTMPIVYAIDKGVIKDMEHFKTDDHIVGSLSLDDNYTGNASDMVSFIQMANVAVLITMGSMSDEF